MAPQVQKSPVFRRDGADIHSDLFISIAQALLGGTARAQGLYETISVAVREEAASVFPTLMLCGSFFLKWEVTEKWLELVSNRLVGDSEEPRRQGRRNVRPISPRV